MPTTMPAVAVRLACAREIAGNAARARNATASSRRYFGSRVMAYTNAPREGAWGEQSMKQRIAVLLVVGMMPWAELHAQAQTATTTFRVTAKVQAVCEI